MDVDAPAGKPSAPPAPSPYGRGAVRAPRNLLAGLSLVALAAFALASGTRLPGGTARAMGPGMLPRGVAVGIGVAGILLVVSSFLRRGARLGRWPLRGPVFVSLAVVAFSLTIRSVGLAIAGPLVVIVSGFAASDVRPKELVVFAIVLTVFCIVLFRYLLGLPIPILSIGGYIV